MKFMIHRLLKIVSIIALGSLGALSSVSASDLITYQGKLTNAEGMALPAGQYRIGIRVWDQPSGGTVPLWARKYTVSVNEGIFSLFVGSEGAVWSSPAPLTDSLKLALSGTNRFLEVTVMSDSGGVEKPEAQWQVLAPRQQLTSVPYALNGVPPGTVVPFAGPVDKVPAGWMLCDGRSLRGESPENSPLFAVIGKVYGLGDGSEKGFSLPDLRSRVPVGAGKGGGNDSQGVALSDRNLASKFGAERHILTVAEMPRHDHGGETGNVKKERATAPVVMNYSGYPGDVGWGVQYARYNVESWAWYNDHTHHIAAQGENSPHNISQPGIALNYIIKL